MLLMLDNQKMIGFQGAADVCAVTETAAICFVVSVSVACLQLVRAGIVALAGHLCVGCGLLFCCNLVSQC